jgi:hypothetical protein
MQINSLNPFPCSFRTRRCKKVGLKIWVSNLLGRESPGSFLGNAEIPICAIVLSTASGQSFSSSIRAEKVAWSIRHPRDNRSGVKGPSISMNADVHQVLNFDKGSGLLPSGRKCDLAVRGRLINPAKCKARNGISACKSGLTMSDGHQVRKQLFGRFGHRVWTTFALTKG